MRRRKKILSLGSELERLAGKLGKGKPLAAGSVWKAWPDAVGPTVNEHTHVIGMRGRELLVAVDTQPWATQLTYMSAELIKKVNIEVGKEMIRDIHFSVSKTVQTEMDRVEKEDATARRYGGMRVDLEPLEPEELAEIERMAEDIKNESIRSAVVKAAVREKEWEKGLSTAKERQSTKEGS